MNGTVRRKGVVSGLAWLCALLVGSAMGGGAEARLLAEYSRGLTLSEDGLSGDFAFLHVTTLRQSHPTPVVVEFADSPIAVWKELEAARSGARAGASDRFASSAVRGSVRRTPKYLRIDLQYPFFSPSKSAWEEIQDVAIWERESAKWLNFAPRIGELVRSEFPGSSHLSLIDRHVWYWFRDFLVLFPKDPDGQEAFTRSSMPWLWELAEGTAAAGAPDAALPASPLLGAPWRPLPLEQDNGLGGPFWIAIDPARPEAGFELIAPCLLDELGPDGMPIREVPGSQYFAYTDWQVMDGTDQRYPALSAFVSMTFPSETADRDRFRPELATTADAIFVLQGNVRKGGALEEDDILPKPGIEVQVITSQDGSAPVVVTPEGTRPAANASSRAAAGSLKGAAQEGEFSALHASLMATGAASLALALLLWLRSRNPTTGA